MVRGMTTTLYGLKTCDTCRKARAALEAGGLQVDFRDVRAEPLSDAELSRLIEAFGEALINRRSTTWRALDDAARTGAPLDLLRAHPALMKRPVIDGPGGVTLGWSDDVAARHLARAAGRA